MILYTIYILAIIPFCESVHTIWNKHYITWSLENLVTCDRERAATAVQKWNVAPIKLEMSPDGVKGNLEIIFKDLNSNRTNSSYQILGYTYMPGDSRWGSIYIEKSLDPSTMFYTLQHEVGHALGLQHYNHSIMETYFTPKNVSIRDKYKIFQLYNCSFDSVSLINDYTYFVFQGSYYKRIDTHTQEITTDTLWFSSEIKYIDAMYRNPIGHYILISGDTFYELDAALKWIRRGKIKHLFQIHIKRVHAVLVLRNNQMFIITRKKVYTHGKRTQLRKQFHYNVPKPPIKGAYQKSNGDIVLIDFFNMWIYNRTFHFQRKEPLCQIPIHCCE